MPNEAKQMFEVWCDANGYRGRAHLENMSEMRRCWFAAFAAGQRLIWGQAVEIAKAKCQCQQEGIAKVIGGCLACDAADAIARLPIGEGK